MHSAFKLNEDSGSFVRGELDGLQGTRHFRDLAMADVIVIDEISMLCVFSHRPTVHPPTDSQLSPLSTHKSALARLRV